MSNSVFPTLEGIQIEIEWIPSFSTQIQRAISGKEYRSNLMASPLYDITLNFEVLRITESEQQQLSGFFIDRQGSYDSFLLTVPDDNTITDGLIGVADGVQTDFQVGRIRGTSLLEPIKNIHTLTNVKVNDVTKTLGSDFTISSTGLISFGSAPLTGNVTVSCTYYYRCRFNDDKLKFSRIGFGYWEAKSVALLGGLGTKI